MTEFRWYRTPAVIALLDKIRAVEAGNAGYNADFRNDDRWTLTNKTFNEVRSLARRQLAQGEPSSAIAGYQFLAGTLDFLQTKLELSGNEIMDPFFQDELAVALMVIKHGFMKLARGEIGSSAFGNNLSREWASFPVLYDQKGAHRFVRRGETYYAGDKLNKALVSPTTVEALLTPLSVELKKAYQAHVNKPDKPTKPEPPIEEPVEEEPPLDTKTGCVPMLFIFVVVVSAGAASFALFS